MIRTAFMQSFSGVYLPRIKAVVFGFIIAIKAATSELIRLETAYFICFVYFKFIHVWLVYSRSEPLSHMNFIEINFLADSAGHNINILISSFWFALRFIVHKTTILNASVQLIRTCKVST